MGGHLTVASLSGTRRHASAPNTIVWPPQLGAKQLGRSAIDISVLDKDKGNEASSAEVRLTSKILSPLSWIVGGYVYVDETAIFQRVGLKGRTPRGVISLPDSISDERASSRTAAGFGSVTLQLTSTLSTTGGIRYTGDRKKGSKVTRSNFDQPLPADLPNTASLASSISLTLAGSSACNTLLRRRSRGMPTPPPDTKRGVSTSPLPVPRTVQSRSSHIAPAWVVPVIDHQPSTSIGTAIYSFVNIMMRPSILLRPAQDGRVDDLGGRILRHCSHRLRQQHRKRSREDKYFPEPGFRRPKRDSHVHETLHLWSSR